MLFYIFSVFMPHFLYKNTLLNLIVCLMKHKINHAVNEDLKKNNMLATMARSTALLKLTLTILVEIVTLLKIYLLEVDTLMKLYCNWKF